MRQYLDALRHVRDNGVKKGDRTGTGMTEVFGVQTRYDLANGFPAMTTKKLYFNSVAHELLWFLKGTGNIEYLAELLPAAAVNTPVDESRIVQVVNAAHQTLDR